MFRKENGVTLVALVITIIVLLILAGVTISMVLDEDGIIKQSKDAKAAQLEASVMDLSVSGMAAAVAKHYSPANQNLATPKTITELFVTELENMDAFSDVTKDATENKVTLSFGNDANTTNSYEILFDDAGTVSTVTRSISSGT